MTFYEGVRTDFTLLRQELDAIERTYAINRRTYLARKAKSPHLRVDDPNERLYYRMREMYNGSRRSRHSDALLYFFINKTAYSGMIRYNINGEFNVPFGHYPSLTTIGVTRGHQKLLASATLHNLDYRDVFAMAKPDDFMFLDPPYDCVFSDYGNAEHKNGFNEKNHRDLAAAFRALPCKALMVIGRTPLTEELYSDATIDTYSKAYAVNIRNRFKSSATHLIVTNYPIPPQISDKK